MRHMAAFYQSVNLAALTALNAVPDTQINVNGINILVPPSMSNVGSALALYNGTTFTQAQLQSPTLRSLAPYDVSPILEGAALTTTPVTDLVYDNPIALTGQEYLNFAFNGGAGGAVNAYGLVELVDGPQKPVTGDIFTVRGTGASALADGTWINTPITFDVILPAGSYNVVGYRAEGAHLIASRIAFIGQANRPGCPGLPSRNAVQDDVYRKGGLGAWGAFDTNQPPSVDCLGNTDEAQVFYFDLIKTK